MKILPAGSRPTRIGPDDAFTGHVQLDPIIGSDPAGLTANSVRFAPGARTFWHSHRLGQTLQVTAGAGYVCRRGEAPQPIRAGDTVWIPADVEHWHGAGPATAMTQLAVQASPEGGETLWLEPVAEADYPADQG